MYLVGKNQKSVAHVWKGEDTACRMASTGGLKMSLYLVSEESGGRRICSMCSQASLHSKGPEREFVESRFDLEAAIRQALRSGHSAHEISAMAWKFTLELENLPEPF